ncbi:hypothetical protein [Paracoccus methylarcula]|uniref:hypothetical protein n=1 Tax=Paracoccus methylarcula TaxID=72022 RepID=UPI001474E5D2
MKFSLLIACPSDYGLRSAGKMGASLFHLGERPGPIALHLQKLGTMHETLTAIGHKIGLGSTPAIELPGPFPCPVQVKDALAGQNDGAVDDPGQHRRHFSGRDPQHRLVKLGYTLDGIVGTDQVLPTAEQSQSQKIGITEPFGDRHGLRKVSTGSFGVSLKHRYQPGDDKPVSLFDTCFATVLDDPLRPGEPTGSLSLLAGAEHVKAEPESPSGRTLHTTLIDESVMRGRPDRDCTGILTDKICRRRKPLQVRGLKGHLLVRGG